MSNSVCMQVRLYKFMLCCSTTIHEGITKFQFARCEFMCYAENIAKTFHSSSTYLSYWPLLFFTKYVVGALVLVGNRPNQLLC